MTDRFNEEKLNFTFNCPKCNSENVRITDESDEYDNGIPCIIRDLTCNDCDTDFFAVFTMSNIEIME